MPLHNLPDSASLTSIGCTQWNLVFHISAGCMCRHTENSSNCSRRTTRARDLRHLLRTFRCEEGALQSSDTLSAQESRIMREVAVFSLASHMVWCLWGLKQVKVSFLETKTSGKLRVSNTYSFRVRHLPFHLPTTILLEISWKTTGRQKQELRAFSWRRRLPVPEI